jgi:hypothetical protein
MFAKRCSRTDYQKARINHQAWHQTRIAYKGTANTEYDLKRKKCIGKCAVLKRQIVPVGESDHYVKKFLKSY